MARLINYLFAAALPLVLVAAQRQTLTVAASGGNTSSPLLFGTLYEDIYHSGDGGLYAELIRNRAFQGSSQNGQASLVRTTDFWHPIGNVQLSVEQSSPPLSASLTYDMRVDVPAGTTGQIGFYNDGFWGFHVDSSKRYAASFSIKGNYNGSVTVGFKNTLSGTQLSSTNISVQSVDGTWTSVSPSVFQPTSSSSNSNNTFTFLFDGSLLAGKSIQVNLLSLFKQTYNNRHNGVREDLAASFNGLKSTWVRLPGGNNMQGMSLGNEWHWDFTYGDLKNRPGHLGVWGDYQTNGFGILEMMQWATDSQQTVVLGLFAGLHIGGALVSQANLGGYIDSSMNYLEFLMGDSSTTWGAKRASLGFPTPFKVDHIEIGNEDYLNGGTNSYYAYRFQSFYDRIRATYPGMTLISTIVPPPVAGPNTWVDLHFYYNQDTFVALYDRFDNANRSLPIIVGEYACIYEFSNGSPEIGAQTMGMALAEGIMLLGAERNSDIVKGTAYGAMIKEYNEEPGTVAVIKHTANQILHSTSYYIQQTFSQYKGEETVAVSTQYGDGIGPVYWSATRTGATRYLKLINYYGSGSVVDVVLQGDHLSTAQVITLTAPDCSSTNKLPQLGGESTTIVSSTLTELNGRFTVAFENPCEVKILIA
ncbi:glycoside hydrolase superfamily [Leptodontidium sp. MPI-SDFR-AT-0119]|nr:glycoside hydrolase superfamily [Leptodontidium sp. MPI-SDFR-AT-0119]